MTVKPEFGATQGQFVGPKLPPELRSRGGSEKREEMPEEDEERPGSCLCDRAEFSSWKGRMRMLSLAKGDEHGAGIFSLGGGGIPPAASAVV